MNYYNPNIFDYVDSAKFLFVVRFVEYHYYTMMTFLVRRRRRRRRRREVVSRHRLPKQQRTN
jgi:hypothetical protein